MHTDYTYIEARRKGVGAWQELTKGAEHMLRVSMKTYTRAVDTKKKRERGVADRPGKYQHVWVEGSE